MATVSDKSPSTLMVRLDGASKTALQEAAALRGMSVSDYVRSITVAQARRDVKAARSHVISMTPEDQLAFWEALQKPAKLTKAQRRLGAIMRGEA